MMRANWLLSAMGTIWCLLLSGAASLCARRQLKRMRRARSELRRRLLRYDLVRLPDRYI